MTLKQDGGYLAWHKLVDPKRGYNNTMFERPLLNSVREKANVKVFAEAEISSFITDMIIHNLVEVFMNYTKFNLIGGKKPKKISGKKKKKKKKNKHDAVVILKCS